MKSKTMNQKLFNDKNQRNFDKYFQEFLKFFIYFFFYLRENIRKYIEIFNFNKL